MAGACNRAEQACGWFGLKVHARNVPLAADLEMHGAQSGYVGFCRLQDGEVNVCGLFRRPGRRTRAERRSRWQLSLLRGQPGTPCGERLGRSDRLTTRGDSSSVPLPDSRCARTAPPRDSECCIGDALTMIPPVTGNGMSMAFEAAEMAIGPLAAYSRGESSWSAGAAERGGGLRPGLRAATRLGAVVAVDDVHAAAARLARLTGAAFGIALADDVRPYAVARLMLPGGSRHPQTAIRMSLTCRTAAAGQLVFETAVQSALPADQWAAGSKRILFGSEAD